MSATLSVVIWLAKRGKNKRQSPQESLRSYYRIFGNHRLGMLASKVQSAVIRSGNELEKLITQRVATIDNLDDFIGNETMPEGVFLATKSKVKKCKKLNTQGLEPDFIIFKRRQGSQHCHVIELKDGHVFDTKKSEAEHTALHRFVATNARLLPYRISTHFCAFNQDRPEAIWNGFKRRIGIDEAMTGRKFCELLEIDYDEIVAIREQDAEENIRYFVSELLHIPRVKTMIKKLLNKTA